MQTSSGVQQILLLLLELWFRCTVSVTGLALEYEEKRIFLCFLLNYEIKSYKKHIDNIFEHSFKNEI